MESLTLSYIQEGPYFDAQIDIDISILYGTSEDILLIVPGVDGSVDGYEHKYKRIAEKINSKHGATVIRMSNPHNPMHDFNRNLFEVLDYIERNFDMTKMRLHIVGHSLGAYVVGSISYMYDYIDKILLINPATRLDQDELLSLQERNIGQNIFLLGEKDPSYEHSGWYGELGRVYIAEGADHNFSDKNLDGFIDAPEKYIFGDENK